MMEPRRCSAFIRLRRPLSVAWALAATLVGCGAPESSEAPEPQAPSQTQSVQTAYDEYYRVALAPGNVTGDLELSRGTVHVPALQEVTHEPLWGRDGTQLRYTCGVTFISPTRAITAAHCVDEKDILDPVNQEVEVRMYRPMKESSVNWQNTATSLKGTFPYYTRTPLGSGYRTRSYQCKVIAKCGQYGTYNCPEGIGLADIALLSCPQRPGCQFGTVSVAADETVGASVAMAWAHEVYAIPSDPTTDLWQHYTQYQSQTENYHYYGASQLLPLASKRWATIPPVEHKVLSEMSTFQDIRYTDLHGCHGTSGSGIAQFTPFWGTHSLLGPAAQFHSSVGQSYDYPILCEDPIGGRFAPGHPGIGFTRAVYTKQLSTVGRTSQDTCLSIVSPAPFNPFRFWLDLDRWLVRSTGRWPPLPSPWPCLSCPTWDRLRFPNEPVLELFAGETLSLPPIALTAGASYRLSMRVRTEEFTLAGAKAESAVALPAPASISVSLGGQVLVSKVSPVRTGQESAGLVVTRFVAQSGSALPLRITAGFGTYNVSELVLIPDLVPNDFELDPRRAGIGILEPGAGNPVPATWTEGRDSDFAALITAGQRLVATRLALLPARPVTVQFDTSRDAQGLSCGLIFANGVETVRSCSTLNQHVAASLPMSPGQQPIAFFIGLPAGQEELAVDNLLVLSQ
ncbi:hypothetical protein JGU66_27330 [Myxococcaceae bacterium JPH2]|nr:hypothetical protein [Myxococcaceae bacterium JPH2]